MPHDKKEIRRQARKILRALPPAAKQQASSAIVDRLLPLAGSGSTLMAYWPLVASEPDIRPALEHWLAQGVTLCLPRVNGVAMSAHRVADFSTLLRSDLGVLEPDPSLHPEIGLDKVGAVLVPGLAFTKGGARLGRGGGHYDRFLARLPSGAAKVGVAFSVQILASVPRESHDIVLDRVVSD